MILLIKGDGYDCFATIQFGFSSSKPGIPVMRYLLRRSLLERIVMSVTKVLVMLVNFLVIFIGVILMITHFLKKLPIGTSLINLIIHLKFQLCSK